MTIVVAAAATTSPFALLQKLVAMWRCHCDDTSLPHDYKQRLSAINHFNTVYNESVAHCVDIATVVDINSRISQLNSLSLAWQHYIALQLRHFLHLLAIHPCALTPTETTNIKASFLENMYDSSAIHMEFNRVLADIEVILDIV